MKLTTVLYEVQDGVAVVTMNRPDALNALNAPLHHDLSRALEAAASDDAVRVVVLTGSGRGFCAGGDIKAMAARIAAQGRLETCPTASPVDTLRDFHALVATLF